MAPTLRALDSPARPAPRTAQRGLRALGLLAAPLALILGGCNATPAPQDETLGTAQQHVTTCLTIQRGTFGTVADTTITSNVTTPGWMSTADIIRVGGVYEGLLKFDVSGIPATATVTSATLSLTTTAPVSNALLFARYANVSWTEATSTYAGFNQQAGKSLGSMTASAPNTTLTMTIKPAAVQGWRDGSIPNYGMLLETGITNVPNAYKETKFVSSDATTVALRPALEVCYTPFDYCAPAPCQNGGACTSGASGYTCACAPGFTGTNCEINIDDCAGGPCQNGGSCADGVLGYTCSCAAGYTGANCEIDVNDCAGGPCQNGGTCLDGINSYACQCTSGWSGTNCDVPTGPTCPCAADPAWIEVFANPAFGTPLGDALLLIGGNMSEVVVDTTANTCASGGFNPGDPMAPLAPVLRNLTPTEAQSCATLLLDPCASNPCPSGSACTNTGIGTVACDCPAGYAGSLCQYYGGACPCAGIPGWLAAPPISCLEGGFGGGYYGGIFVDDAGQARSLAGHALDGSDNYYCLGGNTVRNGLTSTEYQACFDAIEAFAQADGVVCQDPCTPNPCQNGGNCNTTGVGYTCYCPDGYTGTSCEIAPDPCAAAPCQNGGSCAPDGAAYLCACPGGYGGMNCEVTLCPEPNAIGAVAIAPESGTVDLMGFDCASFGPDGTPEMVVNVTVTGALVGVVQQAFYPDGSCIYGNGTEAGFASCSAVPSAMRCDGAEGGYYAMGLSLDGGVTLENQADNSLTPLACGTHDLKLYIEGVNPGNQIKLAFLFADGTVLTHGTLLPPNPCAAAPCQNGGTCAPDGAGYLCTCAAGFTGTNCQVATASLPAGVPGVSLWVKADAGITPGSGASVATWADQSGHGHDLTIDDASRRPTLVSGAQNGLPVVETSAASLQTLSTPTAFSATYSIFYVGRMTGGASGRLLNAVNNNWLLGYWGGAENQAHFDGWVSDAGSPAATTGWAIYGATGTGDLSTVYRDAAAIYSNAGGVSAPSGLTLSCFGGSECSDGQVGEILVYDRVLGAGEIAQIFSYLDARWNVYVDPCAAAPCQNGGACLGGVSGSTCQCPSGWSGATCEVAVAATCPCASDPIWVEVYNHPSVGVPVPPGLIMVDASSTKELAVDTTANTCASGGYNFPNPGVPLSALARSLTPAEAQACAGLLENACAQNPCQHGGGCTNDYPYTCDCTGGYLGRSCEVLISPEGGTHFTLAYAAPSFGGNWSCQGDRVVQSGIVADLETCTIDDLSSLPPGVYPVKSVDWFSDYDGQRATGGTLVITDNGNGTGTASLTASY